MIRTEIDITNPQRVEVIETGEIGYVTFYNNDIGFLVIKNNGSIMHWYKPEELIPLEDEKLVFDVIGIIKNPYGSVPMLNIDVDLFELDKISKTHDVKVIATPKEKSLEDMTKEELIEKWQKRQRDYEELSEKYINDERNHNKLKYKAMATRDCWKELKKLNN